MFEAYEAPLKADIPLIAKPGLYASLQNIWALATIFQEPIYSVSTLRLTLYYVGFPLCSFNFFALDQRPASGQKSTW